MSRTEACITGLGAACAAGVGVSRFWEAVLEGRPGTRGLTPEELHGGKHASRVGAPLPHVDLASRGYGARDERWLDLVSRLVLASAAEALSDAGFGLTRRDAKETGFDLDGADPERVAVVLGSGMGGLASLEAGHRHYLRTGGGGGAGWVRYALPKCIPNAPAAQVAIRHGLRGECKSLSTACAAGTMAIGDACRLIWTGAADVVVCGGAEAVLSDHDGLGLLAFDVLSCLSTRNDDGSHASRPFDAGRDGFVLADGAGVLVIESREHAEARGVAIRAEVLAYESGSEALSMVQPDASGRTQARLMERALRGAGLAPGDVGLLSAHATGTLTGDVAEARAIRAAFSRAWPDLAVTATKGVTGHAIAASGALETIACVRALEEGVSPPTANLDDPDAECELHHVRGGPEPLSRRIAVKGSYGFGGHDAVLVLAGGIERAGG